MDDASRIKASADVVSRIVDGEAVLLDLASGKYFGLNEVGSCVWEALEQDVTVAALQERLLAEFEVDPTTLRADLNELLSDLERRGLIAVESSA